MKHGTSSVLKVGCILLVALFFFGALALLPLPVRAQTVTATVPIYKEPACVAVTPNGAYAYVTTSVGNFYTKQANGFVSVIDMASNTVTATIPVGGYPLGVAITPNGAFA
jgi:YVTN family beta-propeller protein